MAQEMMQNNKEKKNKLPLRLNILFLVVFIAFSGLILRLGYLQIVKGEDYKNALNANQHQSARIESARGKIVDTNGVTLADNKAELAIVYIRNAGISAQESLKLAQKLSNYLTMDKKAIDRISTRDKREYYVLTKFKSLQKAYDQYLTKKEQTAYEKKQSAAYKLLLSRIPKSKLTGYSAKDVQIMAIQHEFNQASNLSPYIIKRGLNVDDQEYINVVDHLNDFNGSIQTANVSSREYIKEKPFYVGKMGQIPEDKINGYLAQGYSRNAEVGVSYLEEQYENYLRGVPMTLTYKTKKGLPVGNPTVTDGKRGDDLQLTIDIRLQKKLDQVLEQKILSARSMAGNGQNNSAYAVMMNPKTGAILAIGGKKYVNGKFQNVASDAITSQFEMGSAVKGATELVGFQHNAVPSQFHDMPINYRNSKKYFKSWEVSGLGTLTPETALQFSSNVFMAKIVSNMSGITLTPAGGKYIARTPFVTNPRFVKAINDLRNGYSQFGLGVRTGIDLPTEGTGYNGGMPNESGVIHQYAIGQFDTYTPLQMVQYISTIANDGKRIQPHLLDSVHEPGTDGSKLGKTVYQFEPQVLNTIGNNKHDLERVQHGLYLVTHGARGTGSVFYTQGQKYKVAAKTGTAQVNANDLSLYNETFVSYAPYDDPQVAIAVVVPKVRKGHQNQEIALEMYKYYDQLYHYTSKN
ncbi:penicillin-binding protein 2 [Sporolactobacillus sp. CPB3-1]|uniref:Penicillin-binding protein 2 n=1 Tax=Sporolactobacillus mangiferae TaxID=2940498 RepID=A0ABT0M6V3_9BACL|nr:penicillin-binding protein 2 [Sporolactobacillus mangiferae]MCL1630388.1 penicillin-binding protein 2 [Sporolactobacillus mangiferae]